MKQRTKFILEKLKEMYPDAKCELNYETPFQLLVATILSAQTTDKMKLQRNYLRNIQM